MKVHDLPMLNACLNACAGIFLFLGWRSIKKDQCVMHKKFMLAALAVSAIFLGCYLTYHFLVSGVTRYQGQGIIRYVYFTILLTHTLLAMLIVPFCFAAVYHAFKQNFLTHIHITKWLLPAWLYVTVTGVLIYLMLYVV